MRPIAEIRKTLLKRQQHGNSSANITCHYSPYIVPARMTQLITETAEKLDIVPMSDHMTVKVLKREAEWTKMPTSTPARPLTVPIKQRVATYIKTRNRIFAQGSSDLVKASGVVKMVNPW